MKSCLHRFSNPAGLGILSFSYIYIYTLFDFIYPAGDELGVDILIGRHIYTRMYSGI